MITIPRSELPKKRPPVPKEYLQMALAVEAELYTQNQSNVMKDFVEGERDKPKPIDEPLSEDNEWVRDGRGKPDRDGTPWVRRT